MPLLTRDEMAKHGGGLLQEASWGFCGEANRDEGEYSALLVFLPFIKKTFDHSSVTRVLPHYMVEPDEKMKRTETRMMRRAEMKTRVFE